jgi:hypothetical protein
MAKTSEGTADTKYHYALQDKNRELVRKQGKAINTSLKTLSKISSDRLPAVGTTYRDDEPTQQHITLPHAEVPDLRLKAALEDAEEECRKSSRPPADPADMRSTAEKKKHRWFSWRD